MVEYPPEFWNPNADKQIVHIDFAPAEIDQNYQLEVEVVGDVAHALWALNERFAALAQAPVYELTAQRHARAEILAELAAHRDDDTQGLIRPQKVLWGTRVAMIWEDHEYGLIAWKQDNHFGRHTDLAFGNPDWLKLADAFGWYGARVQRSADLRIELERAFEAGRPALVVIPIDYRANAILSERLGTLSCPI